MDNWITQVALITESGMVNRIIERALDPKRFEIHIFTSETVDLLQQLTQVQPKIIFLKNLLKRGQGLELCKQIKADHFLQQSTIILLTSDRDMEQQAYQHYANHVLSIPFSVDNVTHLMNQLLMGKKTILLVDDSQVLHRSVVPQLIQDGYNVLQAWDGDEALWLLAEQDIDLIITDVEMPKLNGFELCKAVKSQNLQKVPILMLSSKDEEDDIIRAFNVGADDYITKPIFMTELLSRVKRMSGAEITHHRERILVVDESPVVRGIIAQALLSQGFEVDEAGDGQQALKKIRANAYHLVTIDYEMPALSGYELCVMLRQDDTTSQLPIMVISAKNSQAQQVKLRSVGIQAFISKPFKPDWLITEVERVLAESRLQRERQAIRRYLSDDAIHAATRQPIGGGGGQEILAWDRHRTIFFVDIINFCDLCSQLDSRQVIKILNHFFDKMVGVLLHYNAVIDKFIGDAILALFSNEADGAHRAIGAALDIIKALPALNQAMAVELRVRIGITSGQVIMGDIGSQLHRRDFTVIGDNVNIAETLKDRAESNCILISESTYELVRELVQASPSQVMHLKNREKPMMSYQVKAIQPYSRLH